MTRISGTLLRVIAAVAVVVVVAGGAYYYFIGSKTYKTVTASFASAVGVYKGTPVRILGIQVGDVTSVKPDGGSVTIGMRYDSKYKVPASAGAVIVANSLVSDRYIQLTPVYSGSGTVMASGSSIPLKRTSSPAELDDIYSALNSLSVALGPTGANKNGALSTLVNVAAANLKGNGAALGKSVDALSAAASTLANGKDNLAATVQHLAAFTQTLAQNDTQVRHFESQLAQVAGDLADERGDLGTALHTLSQALNSVAGFVRDNASRIHTDVGGLETLTNILVKEQSALNETLSVAPVALANVVHAYQSPPNAASGTLATRSNIASLTNISGTICGVLGDLNSATGGLLGGIIGDLTGSQSAQLDATCNSLLGSTLGSGLGNILGGGLGVSP